jgi:hypothetical protein
MRTFKLGHWTMVIHASARHVIAMVCWDLRLPTAGRAEPKTQNWIDAVAEHQSGPLHRETGDALCCPSQDDPFPPLSTPNG